MKEANLLTKGAMALGLTLSQNELEKFSRYLAILQRENKRFNLTAIIKEEEIILKHFLDSLTILKGIKKKGPFEVLDLGTGAGFPGVPLKIVRPEISLTLLDGTLKKVNFLKELIKSLALSQTEAVWGRAEEIVKSKPSQFKEKFDLVLARAVKKLPQLLGYGLPFLKRDGTFLIQKGPDPALEIESARDVLLKEKAIIFEVLKFRLPLTEMKRSLIMVKKKSSD